MSTYRILFFGDIVGRPGRESVAKHLPDLMQEFEPRFVLANAENAAAGVGITPAIAEELFKEGLDALTLGNHAFHKREIEEYLGSGKPLLRPANLSPLAPGRGVAVVEHRGLRLAVVNLCGRVFMDHYDDPFRSIDSILGELATPHVLIDFHAEATSEKAAFGFYVDGRATGVVGTHTHVTTADERVLPGGTAYITDVGMCGPYPSVLGMDTGSVLRRLRSGVPTRFEVAATPGVISAVVIDVQEDTGRATRIQRVRYPKR